MPHRALSPHPAPARLRRADLAALDATDPLASARERFSLPPDTLYLDGNSLGALPAATADHLNRAIREHWGTQLIGAWNKQDWLDLPRRLGARIAHLVGARENEVMVADSTSVNLFKLLVGALHFADLQHDPKRRVILSEVGNFPGDLYILQGVNSLFAGRYQIKLVQAHEIADALGPDVAAAVLSHVDYRTGRMHDMAALNARAHDAHTHIVWDLGHSAGAVDLGLNTSGATLAVGCGYKYLNGGPGAPAFVYVAKRLQAHFPTPLTGWFGHDSPFAFAHNYVPADGTGRFQCGTPPILSMLGLECGLATFDGIDLKLLRAKSLALGESFRTLMEAQCAGLHFHCVTPAAPNERGSQMSFAHTAAYAIMQTLIENGVVGDFRQPNLLRFGLAPLYTRYVDIWDAVKTLRDVTASEAWRNVRRPLPNQVP